MTGIWAGKKNLQLEGRESTELSQKGRNEILVPGMGEKSKAARKGGKNLVALQRSGGALPVIEK